MHSLTPLCVVDFWNQKLVGGQLTIIETGSGYRFYQIDGTLPGLQLLLQPPSLGLLTVHMEIVNETKPVKATSIDQIVHGYHRRRFSGRHCIRHLCSLSARVAHECVPQNNIWKYYHSTRKAHLQAPQNLTVGRAASDSVALLALC